MPLTADAACAHCTLPVPAGRVRPGAEAQFCCRGCQTAHTMIHAHGLEAFYALGERDAVAAATGDRELRYADLDREAFLEAHTTAHPSGERTATLGIEGMHCAACLWLLERLPRIVPGVLATRVHWRRATIEIRWAADTVPLSAVAEAIAGLGYRCHPLRVDDRVRERQAEDRSRIIAIGIAFAAAGNNMLIAASLYLGLFSSMDAQTTQLLRWGSCLVGMVSLLGPGRVFFRGALSALRSGTPHMDLPVALGLSVGGIAGLVNTIRGEGELYFDTLSVLVLLLLVGRLLQIQQQRRAAAAVDVLYRLTPRVARRLVDGAFVEIPAEALAAGDVVQVRSGETIVGDGTIRAGETRVDVQVLTGEARPVSAGPGSTVAAGTVNCGAVIEVEITAVGEQTKIGQLLGLVEDSSAARPAIVARADRLGGWFVVTVLALATVTLVGWLAVDPAVAVDHAVSLLIVACPCALALATPLAISVALGRAAQRKILIKGGDVLQRMATPGTIWLDKTGTLTEGRMAVMDACGEGVLDPALARRVAAVEETCTHPTAAALRSWARATLALAAGGTPAEATDVAHEGDGVAGTVDGQRVAIGNGPYVARHAAPISAPLRAAATAMAARAASPTYVAIDGQVRAVLGVGDPIRPEAPGVVDALKRAGWRVGILSGDHPDVVARVANALDIPGSRAWGEQTPRDKVDRIRDTIRRSGADARGGPTVMVGDGVNDSAALAAAGVGIAAHGGAEASLRAAPVYLGRPGLHAILELVQASEATMRGIRRNFAASLAYNAAAVGLAAAGWISPLLAAVLMPASSLTVVALSLSVRWKTTEGNGVRPRKSSQARTASSTAMGPVAAAFAPAAAPTLGSTTR